MLLRCPGKETLSRSHITPSAQKDVDCAAHFIDGSVQVDPVAFHLDISLVHAPRVTHRPGVRLPTLFKIRHVALHPQQDRRMSQQDAPLGHHLDQVTGAELEGEIPSYAEHDDLPVKVPALKELLCRGGFRHRWPLAPLLEHGAPGDRTEAGADKDLCDTQKESPTARFQPAINSRRCAS